MTEAPDTTMNDATVLIVPGLRDAVAQHWQTLLEARLRAQGRPVVALMPSGREDLRCAARAAAIDDAVRAIAGPFVIVAHSAGCIMVAHWAQRSRRRARGALLAAPADFERPMPEGYPTLEQLRAGGWLPVPRARLPFRSIVAASSNDPLGGRSRPFDALAVLAPKRRPHRQECDRKGLASNVNFAYGRPYAKSYLAGCVRALGMRHIHRRSSAHARIHHYNDFSSVMWQRELPLGAGKKQWLCARHGRGCTRIATLHGDAWRCRRVFSRCRDAR